MFLHSPDDITLGESTAAFRQAFCQSRKWTDLHWAAYTRQDEVVRHLLENGADMNETDSSGNTPLHLACRRNYNSDCIATLLEFEPDLNLRDYSLDTPLNLIVRKPTYDVTLIRAFLILGADSNIPDSKGNTPLHHIALGGQSEMAVDYAQELIQYDADVNLANDEGDTPLHIAVLDGLEDLVSLLINSGANIEMENNFGYTQIDTAALLIYCFPSIYEYIGIHYILQYYCRKVPMNLLLLKQFIKVESLRDFKNKCFMEYLQLKTSNIGSSLIKYSDILRMSPDKMATYMEDGDFLRSLMNVDTGKYKIFAYHLEDNLRKAFRRYNDNTKVDDFMNDFMPVFDYEYVDESDDDLYDEDMH